MDPRPLREIPEDPQALYTLVRAAVNDNEYRRLLADGRLRHHLQSAEDERPHPEGERVDAYLLAPDEPDLLDALKPDPPPIV